METDSDISAVVPAIEWLVARISALALPDIRLSYERVEFMASYSKASQFTYNPIPILSYEKTTRVVEHFFYFFHDNTS